ncbi:MAG: tripartite tricarboxylate transporter substrate-binding protein [Proteobacteria bacterium]|nr:tripartite tricarboxylate transporter substrate-binding protein [Pseudomonadota bacterium]
MDDFNKLIDRRSMLVGTGAAVGAAAATSLPFGEAFAANFPARNIQVAIPTRAGGGADRLFRATSGVWKKYINTNFEPSFFPGAAGRVGYEKYMGLAGADGHSLLFGNAGPEVLNWVVKPPSFNLSDLVYFAMVDQDPGTIFVDRNSKFKTIDDIVAEGKKRTLNVGVSRLAHPATLGALALAKHTGAKFNAIPLSGGRNTIAGVTTGEMDFGALPSGSVVSRKNLKIVLMLGHNNPIPGRSDNAPVINDKFGMNLPPMIAGARAYAIKKSAIDNHPDQFKILVETIQKVFPDPDFIAAYKKTKAPLEYVGYRGPDEAAEFVKNTMAVGRDFKQFLTGKKS